MAYLRSDIVNKTLVETVLRKIEGTSRINVLSITIGPVTNGLDYPSLLHEQLAIEVEATVKGKEKTYAWIAKFHRVESGPAQFARFQGIMESEIKFYARLLPELASVGARMPTTHSFLWGDYKNSGKEVLLLENLTGKGFKHPPEFDFDKGLDLPKVILAVEWLAKFHGLFHSLMLKTSDGDTSQWLRDHAWVRTAKLNSAQPQTLNEEVAENKKEAAKKWRQDLMEMATEALLEKVEKETGYQDLQNLLRKQDWMDKLKDDIYSSCDTGAGAGEEFVTLCHGEPWIGNVMFQYKQPMNGSQRHSQEVLELHERESTAVGAVFAGFHSCTVARPGYDLAHFLMTSTTREFRRQYLDMILQTYITELRDVMASQGVDVVPMSLGELKREYRRGLIVAISFCVFVMPVLLGNRPNDREDVNNILADSFEDEEQHPRTLAINKANDQGGDDSQENASKQIGVIEEATIMSTSDVVVSENAHDDEIDGRRRSGRRLPDWATRRLLDAIKDIAGVSAAPDIIGGPTRK